MPTPRRKSTKPVPPVLSTRAPEPIESTHARILDAAGSVFAEKGFRESTVRAICERAGVNIAAINYHFRTKEALHEACMVEAHRFANERYPIRAGVTVRSTPEQRLTAIVRSFVLKVMDADRPSWHGRLMAREMIEPTGALDIVVEKNIRPSFDYLIDVLAELAPELSPSQRRMAAASVVGQCMHYFWCKEVACRLGDNFDDAKDWTETLTRHIVRFTLGGLPAIAKPE